MGTGRKAVQQPRLLWVNTVLGNLKTALSGTYHASKFDTYAQRYLCAYQYRFNHRFDLAGMIGQLAEAADSRQGAAGT